MAFSRNVPRDPADEYVHDRLFSVDRRHNGLSINPGANNYVKTVDDAPLTSWDEVYNSAATTLLSGVPGVNGPTLHGAYVRSAMRGDGRPRNR